MTVDVSKTVAYAVAGSVTADVSKNVAYAVVGSDIAVNVSKAVAYAVVGSIAADVSKNAAYAVLLTPPRVLVPIVTVEPITGGNPDGRLTLIVTEPITGGSSVVRAPLIVIEVLHSIAEEQPVATDILPVSSPITAPLIAPGLPGLTFSTHKKPEWRTDTAQAVSGRQVRAARMEYPFYNFELKFEFLDSRSGADPQDQMQRLMGFFNQMKGSWGNFLYQDPTDYLIEGQSLGVGDGGTTGFLIMKTVGGFTDPVGQVDFANLFTFASTAVNTTTNAATVPDHGLSTGYGPIQIANPGTVPGGLALNTNYWLIAASDSTVKFATSQANAVAGTAIDLTTQGAGTNTVANNIAVFVNGTIVSPADYTYVTPNEIVFDTAPADGALITASCKYYFVCHFTDDMADFEQFMWKLWTLETLEFKTDIP